MESNALPLPPEVFGWLAAALTWLTFCCRDMRRLRVLALCANAAFIAYAALVQLWPVLALHLALVPVNLWRLTQALQPPAPAASARDGSVGRPDGHAAAEQVAVAVDVVHAAHRAPVLLPPQAGQRVGGLFAGVGAPPVGRQQ